MVPEFMISKGKTGNYQTALDYATRKFAAKAAGEMAANSGCSFNEGKQVITVPSLNQNIEVHYPGGESNFVGTQIVPAFSWRLIIINYLGRADGIPLSGKPVSYREVENGPVFFPAFQRETILPLNHRLALEEETTIKEAFLTLGAVLGGQGDVSGVFSFLPRFPVQVKIWLPDEEMSGSANMLFDESANHYLHTEDIAVAGNLITQFLLKIAGGKS